jgi:hypothetical protein
MLQDYFDETLREVINVPRTARQVKLQFGVEQYDVPS